MIIEANLYSPFTDEALDQYAAAMGLPTDTAKQKDAVKSQKQKAIIALRDAKIVWRRARGLYALEDRDMRDRLTHQFKGEA